MIGLIVAFRSAKSLLFSHLRANVCLRLQPHPADVHPRRERHPLAGEPDAVADLRHQVGEDVRRDVAGQLLDGAVQPKDRVVGRGRGVVVIELDVEVVVREVVVVGHGKTSRCELCSHVQYMGMGFGDVKAGGGISRIPAVHVRRIGD
jgi:hypothetical protein